MLIQRIDTLDYGGRLSLSEYPANLSDVSTSNPAYLSHLGRRIVLDMFSEYVKTTRVLLHEIPVIEVFFNDDIHHSQSQSAVSSRPYLDVNTSFRERDPLGVYDNEL